MTFYKFLNDNLTSYHDPEFYYPAPIFKNGKWEPSEWVTEKDVSENKDACGKGLHVMKILIPMYGPYRGNCYEVEGEGLLGQDDNKARFRKIRLLRPIPKSEIIKSSANLSSADLSFANLSFANLSSANLSSANLSSADLSFANLSSANLSFADLSSAENLEYAYWNKFTQIDKEYKKLLDKKRFLE